MYEAARDAGRMTALLDQERPNIFTQHIANIRAGERVRIEISYVERLKYEDGEYEWVFPMVVGPRYIPGTPTGKIGGGWASIERTCIGDVWVRRTTSSGPGGS